MILRTVNPTDEPFAKTLTRVQILSKLSLKTPIIIVSILNFWICQTIQNSGPQSFYNRVSPTHFEKFLKLLAYKVIYYEIIIIIIMML